MVHTQFSHRTHFLLGIGFSLLIASLGYLLALLPGFQLVGPLASAIVLAIVYRQIFGFPERIRHGIDFSSKYLLRLAIILYGLKLPIDLVFQEGFQMIGYATLSIVLAIIFMMLIGKIVKADSQILFLVAVGTGICGAAAIAAVSPLIHSKKENTAISIGLIALIGTVFSIIYTLLLPVLPISNEQYGFWSGFTLHELAHVALAAEPAGEEALTLALFAKLSRVLLLVPFCFILIYFLKWNNNRKGSANDQAKISFPWFLVGFIIMSIVGSYILGDIIPVSATTIDFIDKFTGFMLATAMVGLGLNVSLKAIKQKAMRPTIALLVTSLVLSVVMYFIV